MAPLFFLCFFAAIDAGLWAIQTSASVSAAEQAARLAAAAATHPQSEETPSPGVLFAAVRTQLQQAMFGTSGGRLVRPRRRTLSRRRRRPVAAACSRAARPVPTRSSSASVRAPSRSATRPRPPAPACPAPPLPPTPRCGDPPTVTVHVIGFLASLVPPVSGLGWHAGEIPIDIVAHDAHAAVRDVRRPRVRGADAQAIIETAIVIPILLALISVFLAVMVQVEAQQEMEAATKLAAESFFQAPRQAMDANGTTCCAAGQRRAPTRSTPRAMPKGCRFAAETFYGTMTFRQFLVFGAQRDPAAHPLCLRDGAPLGLSAELLHHLRGRFPRHRDPSAIRPARGPLHGLRDARLLAHPARLGDPLEPDHRRDGRGGPAAVPPMSARGQEGQMIMMLALAFALFLFGHRRARR